MQRVAGIVVLVVLVIVLAVPVGAGPPAHRTGFFIGFGLGFGMATWDWADPEQFGSAPSEWAGTGNLHLGGALREDLVLGAEFQGWAKKWRVERSTGEQLADLTVQMGSLTFAATWWPGNVGYYLRGGIGIGRAQVELEDEDGTVKPGPDTGLALLGAMGYEWRIAEKFALGPQVEVVYLGVDGDIFGNATVFDGSIQFNWYW
jgi:hypothetical protein